MLVVIRKDFTGFKSQLVNFSNFQPGQLLSSCLCFDLNLSLSPLQLGFLVVSTFSETVISQKAYQCLKGVEIQRIFWSVIFCIWTEYENL